MISDVLKEQFIQYLSSSMELPEHNIIVLADSLLFLGVKYEIFNLSYLLKPALVQLSERGYFDERILQFMDNDYFKQPENKYNTEILLKYPIFGFNYKAQQHMAYKYHGHELCLLMNNVENRQKRHSINTRYLYGLDARKFIEYFSNNHDEQFIQERSLPELLTYIRVKVPLYQTSCPFYERVSLLYHQGFRDSHDIVLTREYDLPSYDGRRAFQMVERIRTKSRTRLNDEQDAGSYDLFSKHQQRGQSAFNKYVAMKCKSLAIQKSNIDYIGSVSTVGLNELKFFYDELNRAESDLRKVVIAAVIISAHSGIKYNEVVNQFKDESNRFSFNIRSHLEYELARKSKRNDKEYEKYAEESSKKVLIYFPPKITYLIYLLIGYYSKHQMDKDKIEYEFELLRRRYRNKSAVSLNAERIANFFKIYYPEKYGFDRLLVQYVSMDILTNGITPQYYTLVSVEDLHRKYCKAFNLCDTDLPLKIKRSHVYPLESRFGSANVPKKTYVTELFTDMKKSYSKQNDERVRFNIRAYYMHLFLMLVTGARPLVSPTYSRNTMSFTTRFAVVIDKMSKNYIEFRNQPLCHFVVGEFERYLEENRRMFGRVQYLSSGVSHLGPERNSYLFLLGNGNKHCDFSSENIRQLVFPFFSMRHDILRPNFLRHYFRNCLVRLNQSEEFINMCMGHIKNGQEMYSKFSSVEISNYRKRVQEIQEIIIKEHKIESLFE
ncbi:hypothetical protein [Sphaerochaeta sp.]|uniref:hypothetical protein n=1 Tax=Sphaerochaeta sp. TaxID=1972642 RepID=UPI003D09FEE4